MARDETVAICYDWMLEFVCHDMWEKFKTGCDVDQGLLNLSDGLITMQNCRSSDSLKNRELMFLILTSSLMNMRRTVSNRDEDGLQQPEFRNILRMVKSLSALCNFEDNSIEACRKTFVQEILECCRKNKYDEAKMLFEEDSFDLDKETSRMVKTILQTKSRPHRLLKEYSIEDYLSFMTEYLNAVHERFPDQPVIVKHAEYYLSNSKGREYKGVRSEYFSRQIGEGDVAEEGGFNGKEMSAFHKKLQAIRKRKLKETVNSAENENDSYDPEVEVSGSDPDEAADGTAERGRHSVGPRKKRATREEGERQRSRTRSGSADSQRSGPSHRHTCRTEGRQGRSGERAADVSDEASASDVSAIDGSSDEESEHRDRSLNSRMPIKIKPFYFRRSLQSASGNPPRRGPMLKLRRRWTAKEEQEFYLAVQKHGVGNWHTIKTKLRTGRSNIQLKDKWRNILASSYTELCNAHGPVLQ